MKTIFYLLIPSIIFFTGCSKLLGDKTYVCKCSGTEIFTQTGTEANVASRCAVEADNYIEELIDSKVEEEWVKRQRDIDDFNGTAEQKVDYVRFQELQIEAYREGLESNYSTGDCGISEK